MAIPYPQAIPNPTINLSETLEVPVTRLEMDTGRTRQLLRYSAQSRYYRCRWDLTGTEKALLDLFFRVELLGGTLYFDLPVPAPAGGVEPMTARFTKGTLSATYQSYDRWVVTATLEAFPARLASADDDLLWAVLVIWGDKQSCIDFSSLFHSVVHEILPVEMPAA